MEEDSVLYATWKLFKVFIGTKIKYSDTLIEMIEANINASKTVDLTEQITQYKTSINSGHGVIVIAHSQGNLFTNEAYAKLDLWQQNYFHMMGVASPANSVAGDGPYISYDNDPVPMFSTELTSTIENPRRLLIGPNAVGEYIDSITTDIFHNFSYYINFDEYIEKTEQENNILTIGGNLTETHDAILNFISDTINNHMAAPSQWQIKTENKTTKECKERRAELVHFADAVDLIESVYPFNTNHTVVSNQTFYEGKVYQVPEMNATTGQIDINGTMSYVLGSPTGTSILDVQWDAGTMDIKDVGCPISPSHHYSCST